MGHPANFNDLMQRIDDEQKDEVRSTLIEGLLTLEPKRHNKKNREFWNSAAGLNVDRPT